MDSISALAELPDIPPAIPLIYREMLAGKTWDGSRKRIKALFPELKIQSGNFIATSLERKTYNQDPHKFVAHMHGALYLFSGKGCQDPACRLEAADRLARSFGLIADQVWLSDTISDRLAYQKEMTDEDAGKLLADMVVLARLFPLLSAGIIKFSPQVIPECRRCNDEFETQVRSISSVLISKFRHDFKIKPSNRQGLFIDTGKSFDPPLIMQVVTEKSHRPPTIREYMEECIDEEVRSTLWAAREAALSRGTLLSNSRLGLCGLIQKEGRPIDARSLMLMDKSREITIPWVSELSAMQILQLRSETEKALPLFRRMIAKAMTVNGLDSTSSQSPDLLIEELRDQADQVKVELELKKSISAKYWKTTFALLGLGISAYGLASDQVTTAVSGLLPIINLLIGHKTGHESEIAKLTTRPGYVLVKARDILAHAKKL